MGEGGYCFTVLGEWARVIETDLGVAGEEDLLDTVAGDSGLWSGEASTGEVSLFSFFSFSVFSMSGAAAAPPDSSGDLGEVEAFFFRLGEAL